MKTWKVKVTQHVPETIWLEVAAESPTSAKKEALDRVLDLDCAGADWEVQDQIVHGPYVEDPRLDVIELSQMDRIRELEAELAELKSKLEESGDA